MRIEDLPFVLDVPQTADVFDVGEWTIREWIRSGELRALRVGRKIRVPRVEVAKKLGEADDLARATRVARGQPLTLVEGDASA